MADGKMSQVLKEDLNRMESMIADFDLALQNMMKRAIASGIVEQNNSESKRHLFLQLKMSQETRLCGLLKLSLQNLQLSRLIKVIANVKPITDPIKDSVAIDGERELEEEKQLVQYLRKRAVYQLLEKYTISLKLIVISSPDSKSLRTSDS